MNGIFWDGEFASSGILQIWIEMYVHKVYEPFLKGKEGLTIVDCGANIGLFSLYAAPHAERIVSLEPAQRHADAFNAMKRQNGLENVFVVPAALSDKDGTARFYRYNGNATTGALNPHEEKWDGFEEVRTITAKTLFCGWELEHVDLLKLDIEGGEAAVLRSSEFAEVAPRITCIVGEHHAWSDLGRYELKRRLESLGYRFEWLTEVDAAMFSAVREEA